MLIFYERRNLILGLAGKCIDIIIIMLIETAVPNITELLAQT